MPNKLNIESVTTKPAFARPAPAPRLQIPPHVVPSPAPEVQHHRHNSPALPPPPAPSPPDPSPPPPAPTFHVLRRSASEAAAGKVLGFKRNGVEVEMSGPVDGIPEGATYAFFRRTDGSPDLEHRGYGTAEHYKNPGKRMKFPNRFKLVPGHDGSAPAAGDEVHPS